MPPLSRPTGRTTCWRPVLMLAGALAAPLAAQPAKQMTTANFSGVWRLDDRTSDDALAVLTRLRLEARREMPPSAPAPPSPSGFRERPRAGSHGMGESTGRGGGMGGGHGHRGDRSRGRDKPAATASSGAIRDYPLPPLLKIDPILLVQQDRHALRVGLDNGERLDLRLDGQARQSFNGDALVRAMWSNGRLQVSIEFTDGSRLEQIWQRSADGHRLDVLDDWKIPALVEPIHYRRSYLAVE